MMPPESDAVDLKTYFLEILEAIKQQISDLKSTDLTERKEFMTALGLIENRVGKLEQVQSHLISKTESLQAAITELEKYKEMIIKLTQDVAHVFESIREIKTLIASMQDVIAKNKSVKVTIFCSICTPLVTTAILYMVNLFTSKP